ncbi:MAG TPA: TonB-dependent receptor [Sphingomicrobium sp.]|nr:TonB-dependent receptor [Sphingomicrobium sp.]
MLRSTTAWALLAFTAATAANAQSRDHFTFNQPAETLSQALRDVAVRTGRNVIAPADLIGTQQAAPLSGTFTAEEAVARLLAGTGLRYRLIEGTLVVERIPFAEKGAGPGNAETAASAITVTGTRIRGAGSASPVTVVTRRQLERSGINDLSDFTRILPQNYTGGQNRGIAGGGEQGGQQNLNDSAALNLRGLGQDATLTLLNGHRLSYDALDQGVDISAIPLAAIDRIEVIADGASALYGSDAVAGVANVILRRDYEGLETTARIGGSTSGGNFQQEYSLVGGHRWTSGGFMLALDRSNATPITAGQRDYTRTVDRSLFLTDRIRQTSGVLSAHQQIAPGLDFDVDGTAMNRRSLSQNPFLPTADVHVEGLVARGHVRSWALSPTLRADIGPWRASLSATAAGSRTLLNASNFFNSVPTVSRLLYADSLRGVETTAEGPLFALPGGDARLALGGGLRRVSLHVNQQRTSGVQSITTENFTERRSVQFAYGELSLPLVRPDLSVPLIDLLTLSAALRYEHWNGISSVTTPKLGLLYRPFPDVTVRATWGKSFKIPTLLQVNETREGDLLPGFIFTPPPEPAGSPVLLLAGSAPNLKPERATTWSGTFELQPRSIPGLDLQATYFHIDYRDRIAAPVTSVLTALFNPLFDDLIIYNPTADQVNALIASLPGGLINQTGAPFDPSAVGAIIDGAIRNTERQRIHGVDLSADYHVDLGAYGGLTLTGTASYLKSNQQLAPNQPAVQLAGTIFHPPHWRGRGGAVWNGKRTGFSAFVNYVGPTTDNRFPARETIGAFVTLDLNASVRTGTGGGLLSNLDLRLSALNVLNQKPHFIRNAAPEAAPYDSTNESPVGRFLGIAVRKVW